MNNFVNVANALEASNEPMAWAVMDRDECRKFFRGVAAKMRDGSSSPLDFAPRPEDFAVGEGRRAQHENVKLAYQYMDRLVQKIKSGVLSNAELNEAMLPFEKCYSLLPYEGENEDVLPDEVRCNFVNRMVNIVHSAQVFEDFPIQAAIFYSDDVVQTKNYNDFPIVLEKSVMLPPSEHIVPDSQANEDLVQSARLRRRVLAEYRDATKVVNYLVSKNMDIAPTLHSKIAFLKDCVNCFEERCEVFLYKHFMRGAPGRNNVGFILPEKLRIAWVELPCKPESRSELSCWINSIMTYVSREHGYYYPQMDEFTSSMLRLATGLDNTCIDVYRALLNFRDNVFNVLQETKVTCHVPLKSPEDLISLRSQLGTKPPGAEEYVDSAFLSEAKNVQLPPNFWESHRASLSQKRKLFLSTPLSLYAPQDTPSNRDLFVEFCSKVTSRRNVCISMPGHDVSEPFKDPMAIPSDMPARATAHVSILRNNETPLRASAPLSASAVVTDNADRVARVIPVSKVTDREHGTAAAAIPVIPVSEKVLVDPTIVGPNAVSLKPYVYSKHVADACFVASNALSHYPADRQSFAHVTHEDCMQALYLGATKLAKLRYVQGISQFQCASVMPSVTDFSTVDRSALSLYAPCKYFVSLFALKLARIMISIVI